MPKPIAPGSATLSTRFAASLRDFRDDERGAMAIFMITVFFLMLVFGGIAVDYMRFEIRRVALQQTMDRAALAAANLENTRNPQDVVNDYWAKAKLGEGLVKAEYSTPVVTVLEGQNNSSKQVSIRADVRSYNYFMGMGFMPVDYLEGPALTKAVQGASQVEVMLVLDITGSMDSALPNDTKKKITGLIEAATLFVNEVKDNDDLNQVSIGIVPYNTQVNLGPALRAKFAATNIPTVAGIANAGVTNVNCLEVPTTTTFFQQTAIPTDLPLPMSVHADLEGGTSTGSTSYYVAWNNTGSAVLTNWTTVGGQSNYMCPANAYSEVLLPTMDKTAMLDKINSLRPGGRTSIMMGMRWGVALLDETARPIYSDLRAGESSMVGRPANNTDAETRKIIVLMTDGAHVATSYVREPYKTGISPIYRSDVDNNFSIFHDRAGTPLDYWVPHLCTGSHACTAGWRAQPWSNSSNSGTFRQLDWSEVWQSVRITWVARQLYGRSNYNGTGVSTIYNNQMLAFKGDDSSNATAYVPVATMNSLLQTNCAAAKATGMEVYGIAFGAGSSGETQIRGCASAKGSDPSDKTGYYFQPQTSAELATVFRDIASQISKLRLTQ
ncbi:pilus assembly protein TadG-related protein [Tabrizicola aquatica]|uniref:pilus assembly protein TadG-related protein n=1 Tax=Tabrizicola aquatica TaxID=909926 RepID=UPI0015E174E9|nr:pilus assembly protein TadG-related protein [Tabrizicola aquatica]